ncbi:MAG: hypothetical protein IIA87_03320 [Nanoarchaeota archaeon]|nr:hypothetical protein [Nanoarchaeota archaeon]
MSWTLTKEIYTPKDDWGQDIVLEGIRRYIKEILEELNQILMYESKEKQNLKLYVDYTRLIEFEKFIREKAGRGVMKVDEREKRKEARKAEKNKQKSISKGIK